MNGIIQGIKDFPQSLPTRWVFIALSFALLSLAWQNRFIQDDAFISFRYAEHLANGHGLTWNIGEKYPVEGYTNFLWTLLISAGISLDIDPKTWSMILGIGLGLGTLLSTYLLSFALSNQRWEALLAVFLLGTNYTFSSYMTGGLETQLQAFLVTAATLIALSIIRSDRSRNIRLLALSTILGLAVMTRLDSGLFAAILLLAVGYHFTTPSFLNSPSQTTILDWACLIFPGALLVGSWLLFKMSYYGEVLPNTFHVKVSGSSSIRTGVVYLYSFFAEYGLVLLILCGALCFNRLRTDPVWAKFALPTSMAAAWLTYVISIGGDFMEYRFMVPVLPIIYIIVAHGIWLIKDPAIRASLVLALLFGSFYHGRYFLGVRDIESIESLRNHLSRQQEDWIAIGDVLNNLFGHSESPVLIATTAAGAIPYYSKMPTIDMLGLNDRWIARHGLDTASTKPGHSRHAPLAYLIDSKVHLVLGHPVMRPLTAVVSEDHLESFLGHDEAVSSLPLSAEVIELPINGKYRVDILYLTRNPAVDNVIEKLNIRTHELAR